MLQIYPDRLLDFAVDGIIKAASVDGVAAAQDTLAYARRRATETCAQAEAEAEALRATAAREGYRDGLCHAVGAFLPVIQALHDQRALLAEAVAARMDAALQAMSASPDVVVPQLRAALRAHLDRLDEGARPVLYLPSDHDDVVQAARADPALAALEIRTAARRAPLLELGPLAWELDLPAALEEDIQGALTDAMPEVTAALDTLADHYARRLLANLHQQTQTRRFQYQEIP